MRITAEAVAIGMLLSMVVGVHDVSAQTRGRTVSVSGLLSRASTWDDEGSLGSGAGVGLGVALDLTPSLAIELDLMRGRHERLTSQGTLRWEGAPTVGTAGVRYRFGSGRLRPYVSGGVGLLRYAGSFTESPPVRLPPGTSAADYPMRTVSRSGTGFAMAGGLGLEVDIAHGWFVQPDARLVIMNPDNPEPLFSITRTGISFGYRWR